MYLPSVFYVSFLRFMEVVQNISELVSQLSWTKMVIIISNRFTFLLGDISVPCEPGLSPQAVFNFLVKNASKYEFSTLPLNKNNNTKSSHVLLGTDRVLTQAGNSLTKTFDILRDNNEYDISFVVSLKDWMEDGVFTMEYVMLMTSRRELFPKLTLDLRLRKKSPSSGSLSTMTGSRKGSLQEGGDTETGKGIHWVVLDDFYMLLNATIKVKIKILKSKQCDMKVLLNSFHLNGHTLGFHP